jgi:hypothetical protein
MPLEDRFTSVLHRTLPLLPAEFQNEFAMMISPAAIAMVAGTLAVWAGSHYFGVGFIADAVMVAVGFAFLGLQVVTAAEDLAAAVGLTYSARSNSDLDQAAQHLANFIAVVGVAVFSALVMKGAKRVAPKAKKLVSNVNVVARSGMTQMHFRLFQLVAQQENLIIAVRNTNVKSTPLIRRGFPAKPMAIKAKTSKKTGIVTVDRTNEKWRAHRQAAHENGYAIVDTDGVARTRWGNVLELSENPGWKLEPGQIIDTRSRKPLVGDYDLLGIIDPKNPGQNAALAAENQVVLQNWTNPRTREIAARLNNGMDQPRVMHGGHDQWRGAKLDLSDADGSTVFMPDGEVFTLNTGEDVAAYYAGLKRRGLGGDVEPSMTPEAIKEWRRNNTLRLLE